ncbi:MAG TPA: thymidine phosphorylase [Actinomycetota bacterium]|nr:thymidine phosphorylase [Actinomycetota bacterium]
MSMRDPRDVVAAKRDGRRLPSEELAWFVQSYARGEIPDYLAAAFLMATFIRGLDAEETLALTRAMVDSGTTLALRGVSRPKVDKHSTGGVADGVTLVFAPIAASLGLAVAKLSGRGLGHTGGTLDKLEAIPGLRTDLEPAAFERQVEEVGCAVAAQTADLVPADGALYALRDATATVPSIPLIAASVMSKKLAVATDLVLLDVKAGGGAFMKTVDEAKVLARACTRIAADWGRPCRAAVTDMSQPLGEAIGNALDVAEAVDVLSGRVRGRLRDLAVMFAGEAASRLTGAPMGEGREEAARALDSGTALETFRRMVEAQGGDPRVADDPRDVLPAAPVVRPIVADRDGYLVEVDAEALGRASGELGAGRRRKGDVIDPAVGIVFRPKLGDLLQRGQEIGAVHARDEGAAERCVRRVLAAMTLSESAVQRPPLVYAWYGGAEGPE